jgi:thiopeptide-type bacteriocin biosynthesis protein
MSAPAPGGEFAPFGFVVARTPLLPFAELEAWGGGLAAPAALAAGADPDRLRAALDDDRATLRRRLRAVVERPEVREALYVASPSLVAGLEEWRRDPEGKKGQRAEQALVRYLVRMAGRPTPFGLFSGCSLGRIGERTALGLAERGSYRRHTRLDMDYLFGLAEELGRDPALRAALDYRPNSSLYRSGGRLRYAEAQQRDGARSYHLVAVTPDPFVERALERARGGAGAGELAAELVAADPDGEVALDEAEEFVGELIGSQLLVSDLAPLVTGGDALADLVARLRAQRAPEALPALLAGVADGIAELDAAGVGADPERYEAIARRLEALPAPVERSRLFQVDMMKPTAAEADLTLGPEVVAELERGVRVLALLVKPPRGEAGLAAFREAFLERYGSDRAVPLVEVLDEELGIGFEPARGGEASPLLAGLDVPAGNREPTVPWGPLDDLLAARLGAALARGSAEIELGEDELKRLAGAERPPLPDTFEALATVAAASPEALAGGEFELFLRTAGGPAGRLLGRFCHLDPALRAQTEALLRAEEGLDPDAVFAEIVHLPQGRIGNVLCRPVLREYEIPFLGRGGAPEERRIPVTDLLVSVAGARVVLHSARLGRRVAPRLTSAHNYISRSQGVYRFLASLQAQGVQPGLSWSWGALESFPFLPRVRAGRVVLARARWRIDGDELRRLDRPDGAGRYREVQAWRERRALPRWVVLPDGDNELVVDLDNPLAIDALLGIVRRRPRFDLGELFPAPDRLLAAGPEGRFVHELVVPFVRRGEPGPGAGRAPAAGPAPVPRRFAPGSEWLFAKLYTGSATADRVLAAAVERVVRPALASGAADGWFFLRYGDPHWHLRLRLHGEPRRLRAEALPALAAAAEALLADGQIWKLQLDTYEREVERYGGPSGIALAERVFHADSEAVLALLELVAGDEGADARWRLALAGCARLLDDLGLTTEEQLAVAERIAAGYAREHGADPPLRKQLAARLRVERSNLEALLAAGDGDGHPLAPALAVLARRSRRLAPVVAELRRRAAAGRLTLPLTDLAPSYLHMFVNRLLRAEARVHEMVLYDFLHRLLRGRETRAQSRVRSAHG